MNRGGPSGKIRAGIGVERHGKPARHGARRVDDVWVAGAVRGTASCVTQPRRLLSYERMKGVGRSTMEKSGAG